MKEADETAALLEAVPGGRELLKWFSGAPNFGDAEIIAVHLDRVKPSTLVLEVQSRSGSAIVTLVLGDWIDVSIRGFSHQNVIGGLVVRRAAEREIAPWEIGVGAIPGAVEIELKPIFGACGIIRATLVSVAVQVA
jgi:hypothetical protein